MLGDFIRNGLNPSNNKVLQMHYTRRNVISVFVVLAIAGPALGQSGWEDGGSVVHLTTSTDRVRIGTSTSAAKLTIANTTEHLRLVANSSIHDPWITSWDENQANRFWILKLGDRSNSNAFSIFSESEFSDVFTIKPDGNVGIGTASPSYPLDVAGEVMFRDMLVAKNTTNASVCKLQFDTSFQSVSNVWRFSIGGSPTANGFALGFFDNVPNLWLSNNGNVGIGTTTPSEKLAVNGTITAKEVKVTSIGWPDHVFHAGYDLMPLPVVERYIAEHQHLPGVPSAEEVAVEGLSLGETQALLLQKIEELTLYVIDLKNENEVLKERVGALDMN